MDRMLTVAELAERCGLNPATILRALAIGTLQGVRFGRHYRMTEEQAAAWLASRAVSAHPRRVALHNPRPESLHRLLATRIEPYFVLLRGDDTIEIPGARLRWDDHRGYWVSTTIGEDGDPGRSLTLATPAALDTVVALAVLRLKHLDT